jgi:hypothetical protein
MSADSGNPSAPTSEHGRIFCVFPGALPAPGHCPACAVPLDELGCRIAEAYLTTPAERIHTGVRGIYEVHCRGTPVIRLAPCPFEPHR